MISMNATVLPDPARSKYLSDILVFDVRQQDEKQGASYMGHSLFTRKARRSASFHMNGRVA